MAMISMDASHAAITKSATLEVNTVLLLHSYIPSNTFN